MKRKLFLAGLTIAALLAIAALSLVIRNRIQSSRTQELIAQWHDVGGASSLAQLKPEPIPDEHNAAVLYQQAFRIVDSIDESEMRLIANGRLTDQTRNTLDRVSEAIELAGEAVNRPHCQWTSTRYEEGFEALVPHLGSSHALKYVLCLAALRAAESGETSRSMELLNAVRQLAGNCAEEPMIWGLLVGAGHEKAALEQFRDIFADRALPSAGLDGFLETRLTQNRVRRAMLTEGAMAIDWIQNYCDPSDGVATRQQELSFFVSAQLRVLEELPKPHYQRDWTFIAEMSGGPPYQSGVLFPPLQTALENLERVRRLELAAETAVKLRHYRDVHGEYPPPGEWKMPIDPLSGKPMIYRRTDTGFEITGSLADDEHSLSWQWQ